MEGRKKSIYICRHQVGRSFLWILIVAPAIVDWLHGFAVAHFGISVIASTYRLALLALAFGLLIFRPTWVSIWLNLVYALYVVLALLSWSMVSQIYLAEEIPRVANVLFLPACIVILEFSARRLQITEQDIINQLVTYGTITAAIVVLSLILGIGEPTYYKPLTGVYGFGTQSYYIEGNVLGLTLVVSLAVALCRLAETISMKHAIIAGTIFAGAFCVGSRTGLIVSTLLVLAALLFLLVFTSGQIFRRLALAAAIVPLLAYGLVTSYGVISEYSHMTERFQELAVGQVRGEHSAAAWRMVSAKPAVKRITGESFAVHLRQYAFHTPKKGVDSAAAESDPVDTIGAYGYIGLVIMYLPYAIGFSYAALQAVVTRRRIFVVASIGLALFIGHSILAGHVLFSSKSTQLASVFIFLALWAPVLMKNRATLLSRVDS